MHKPKTIVLSIGVVLFISGCGEDRGLKDKCYRDLEGETVFIASYSCIAHGSPKQFRGYLQIGFEHSLFYPTLSDLQKGDTGLAYWVEVRPGMSFSHEPVSLDDDDEYLTYPVTIEGWISEKKGFYGHGFSKGLELAPVRGGIAADIIRIEGASRKPNADA